MLAPAQSPKHEQIRPSRALAPWVAHFWTVAWSEPGRGETLPHPSCHLVFETKREPEIFGVPRGKFTRVLEGSGRVLGVKFRPGCFRPFIDRSVSTLTGRVIPASEVFGASIRALHTMKDVAAYLEARLPEPDPDAQLAASIVERIISDPSLLSVQSLAIVTGEGVRTLQRLFKEYVGVSPKWVIRRYRLHEVVDRMHREPAIDFAALAAELGYADQAHLIRDFRTLAGVTPAAYLALVAHARQPK